MTEGTSRLFALLSAAMLASCATTPPPEPVVRTVTVNVPVAVPCVPETIGEAPVYSDSDEAVRAAADGAERYRLLFVGRGERNARLAVLESALGGCRE